MPSGPLRQTGPVLALRPWPPATRRCSPVRHVLSTWHRIRLARSISQPELGARTADHAVGIALVRRLRESLRDHDPNLVAPHQQCLVLEVLWPRCENCMYERRH